MTQEELVFKTQEASSCIMRFSFPSSAECLECIIHATLSRNEIRCCSYILFIEVKRGKFTLTPRLCNSLGMECVPFKCKG